MGKPETKVGEMCSELGITRVTLYRYVGPSGDPRRPSRAQILKQIRLQANPAELYVPFLGFTSLSAVKHEELPVWSGKLLRRRCRVAMMRIRMFVVTIGIRINIMGKALAHTSERNSQGHLLLEHLRDVARRSRELASMASPSDPEFAAMASWAGWLHDLGKYREEFQAYLLGKRQGGIDTQHAVFGAARALQLRLPWAVAISILGHHAGLSSVSKARVVKVSELALVFSYRHSKLAYAIESKNRFLG